MDDPWECDHSAMTECCDGCGHFSCPCGITWDEGSEGGPFDYDNAWEVEEWIGTNREQKV
jgi:hypothetical protein